MPAQASTERPGRVALDRAKAAVLPQGRRIRRLPVGIGRGLRLEIDFAAQTKQYLGLYEIELNRWLRRLVKRGESALDVGGYGGYDALLLAKLGASQVVSFEAEPDRCARMEAVFAANPEYAGRLSVRCGYVGTGDRMTRLDEYAGLRPGFVKIDVDGHELAVLESAREVLAGRPNLIVETHSAELEEEVNALLSAAGFELRIVDQRRWLKDFRPIERNRWTVAWPRPKR
jgi:hypothetical protein